ncbi:uncharacterized protein LOC117118675 [Anneissia japonica]|uniref:uncharacterized protein LOC117118675 n=1 Tax=Anneissia japonica TaxID=1529436 RepID=UPI001425537E|nr:uncharacterized protein LOC117118675 [Anneissia japonica]
MCNKWGIKQTTSSPRYPRSNGLAERMVQTVKATLKKCIANNDDINLALLHIRATTTDCKLPSPAEMLFGRPIRTNLPSYHPTNAPPENHERLLERSDKMKSNHDRHAGKDIPPLHLNQRVRTYNAEKPQTAN